MHRVLALFAALSVSFLTTACVMPISEIDRELRASLDELERAGDAAAADLAALDPLAPAPKPATFKAKRKAYKASLKPKAAAVVTAPDPAVETPPAATAEAANGSTDPALVVPDLPPLK
jgi:hypothetical protein